MSAPVDVLSAIADASTYVGPDAQELQRAHLAIARLIEASKRSVEAFEALGLSSGVIQENFARKECVAALVAQKEALSQISRGVFAAPCEPDPQPYERDEAAYVAHCMGEGGTP